MRTSDDRYYSALQQGLVRSNTYTPQEDGVDNTCTVLSISVYFLSVRTAVRPSLPKLSIRRSAQSAVTLEHLGNPRTPQSDR
jgi:hypothetical protein